MTVADANVSQYLLAQLGNGQWALPNLLPVFRQALEEATGVYGQALTALTMLRYRLAETPPQPLASSADLVEQRQDQAIRKFWNTVASRVVAGTYYQPASDWSVQAIYDAIACMDNAAPLARAALEQTIRHIVCLDGASFGSASHPWLFGCIFCSADTLADSPEALAETLVHEVAHHEMFLLHLVDRLVLTNADDDQQFAPFQGRVRPTIGRLHSAHALFRMVEYQRLAGGNHHRQVELLAQTMSTLQATLLTPFGARLVDEVYASQCVNA